MSDSNGIGFNINALRSPFGWKTNAFYQAARNELRKRGIL